MRFLHIFITTAIYLLSEIVHCSPIKDGPTAKCGYQSCNPVKDDMLNVHLVPHTHDDVGWLKTVDQYYYGDKNYIQNAGVQYILDSVIPQLVNDPTKRFIYVEIAFFERWWDEQTDSMRHVVQSLVSSGRLEFILGGWCMNDEASTHYNAIIDQHTIGFEFLRQNFGECGRPRVAWQIDPFGHSREQASLFAGMGFDGLFFGRLDIQDKTKRLGNKTMEMMWKGSPENLGDRSNLFTGVNFNLYQPPPGFCFDISCTDEPIMDDERMHDYNVKKRVDTFLNYVHYQASFYKTNHILLTMGSDFQYSNANTWYKNLDKLIKHTNARQSNGSKVNLLYSTPSCYLYQLNRANQTWTTKEDDFFPYSDSGYSYWTGYFTSRASLKGYVRETNNYLQVVKQLDALAKLTNTDNSTHYTNILKKAMGVLQHHDAVSGTEKQAVAYDYAERLAHGINECQKVIYDSYRKLLPLSTAAPPPFSFCSLTNISNCNITEIHKQVVVVVYNPMSWLVNSYVRLPVVGDSYTVTSSSKTIEVQVLPVTNRTKEIPERKSLAQYEILFPVSLPPMGFQTYFVQATRAKKRIHVPALREMKQSENVVIKNEYLQLTFEGASGRLTEMKNLKSDITIPLHQGFYFYDAYTRNYSGYQTSGAYIFRPNSTKVHEMVSNNIKTKSYYMKGRYVQEVHQIFSSWATQVVRLYEGEQHAEFEWTIGPIDVDDHVGKEVITRFETGFITNATYYTDSNGREILKRIRDYRPTWKLYVTQPVAGNYYPVNSRIYLRDEERKIQFTVLTDRSQGGASIQDGNLELMLHRRLLQDDRRGVGEALDEMGSDGNGLIVRGKHYVVLETIDNSASVHRDLAQRLYMAPSLSYVATSMKERDWKKYFKTEWSGLQRALPRNVHLLTLEKFTGKSFLNGSGPTLLLRLEHIYEKNEDQHLSLPVKVELNNLFVPFKIVNIVELVLGGNLKSSDLHRLKWKTTDSEVNDKHNTSGNIGDQMTIELTPMQIRSFEIEINE